MAKYDSDAKISVLEVGAGCGSTLSRLKYLFPKAYLYGIEEDALAVKYSVKNVKILTGDWRTMELPFEESIFDYVIYTDRWGKGEDMEEFRKQFEKYIKCKDNFLF